MKADNPVKHFAIALAIAVVIYIIAYGWIEHRRNRNGPWEVTFTDGATNAAMLVVNQSNLGITNVQIVFAEAKVATNAQDNVSFRTPRQVPFELPFGQCVFLDLTFLPGTVTFRMFGHEIELLPRVMMLDHEEHPWRSGEVIQLRSVEKKL